jgi:hypothetical protein
MLKHLAQAGFALSCMAALLWVVVLPGWPNGCC